LRSLSPFHSRDRQGPSPGWFNTINLCIQTVYEFSIEV
jgi:hypothetical protein